jgi:hypothetical protein
LFIFDIYTNLDILYKCRTQIHKAKKMLTDIVMIMWACLGGYLIWYVAAAKCDMPLTLDEARVLWKMHKRNTNCTGHKWRSITRKNGKVLGFECECGYKYKQKRRLIASSAHRANN